MHKYGDVVFYQLGNDTVKALVVQSNPQIDGEHLTVVYLDPKAASSSMSGMMVDKAIARAFAPPLTEGKTYGWKDIPAVAPTPLPSAADLDAVAEEKKAEASTAAPDNVQREVQPGEPESPKGVAKLVEELKDGGLEEVIDHQVSEEPKAAVATDPPGQPSESSEPSSSTSGGELASESTPETPKPIPTTSTFSGPGQ